jgi:hypothetical protein
MSIDFGLADESGQALGAAHAGHDAQVDFGLAELGGVGGNDEIAHHRQFAAAAQRIARHAAMIGLRTRSDGVRLRGEEVFEKTSTKDFSDISLMSAPAAKAFSDPVSTMQRTLSLASSAVRPRQFAQQLCVQRIQRLGPVQPDRAT